MTSNRVVNSSSTGSRSRIFILFVGVGDDDDDDDLLIRRRRRRLMLDELLSLLILFDVMEAGKISRKE
jgi:hypothetical protein